MIPTLPQGMNRFLEYIRDSLVLLLFFSPAIIFFHIKLISLSEFFFFFHFSSLPLQLLLDWVFRWLHCIAFSSD